jgi:hypothetical protein
MFVLVIPKNTENTLKLYFGNNLSSISPFRNYNNFIFTNCKSQFLQKIFVVFIDSEEVNFKFCDLIFFIISSGI